MSDELEILKSVTAKLDSARIPYMVTGSMAVNYYATPRMTRDIDLVVELSEEDRFGHGAAGRAESIHVQRDS